MKTYTVEIHFRPDIYCQNPVPRFDTEVRAASEHAAAKSFMDRFPGADPERVLVREGKQTRAWIHSHTHEFTAVPKLHNGHPMTGCWNLIPTPLEDLRPRFDSWTRLDFSDPTPEETASCRLESFIAPDGTHRGADDFGILPSFRLN